MRLSTDSILPGTGSVNHGTLSTQEILGRLPYMVRPQVPLLAHLQHRLLMLGLVSPTLRTSSSDSSQRATQSGLPAQTGTVDQTQ